MSQRVSTRHPVGATKLTAVNEPLQNRRTFLRRIGALAGVPGLAALVAACGGNSPDTTVGGGSAAETSAASTASTAASTPGASTATTVAEPVTTSATAATTAPAASAPPAAPNALNAIDMTINVTYAVDPAAASAGGGGGRKGGIENPYVAVWLETVDGAPVRTISLSYQKGKGDRWLPDLKRWYAKYQAQKSAPAIAAVTGATRVPGSYSYSWNGTDDNGQPVAAGEYVLVIEGSRERGPYSLAKQTISLTGVPFSATLPDNGELKGMTVELKAA
jgi:hypothetical protein